MATFDSKLKSLEKTYAKTIFKATDLPSIGRIKTGVFVFDLLTGGGIPTPGVTIFHGKKSSGKTTMLLKTINAFLEQNPTMKAVIIDFERSLTKEWAMHFIQYPERLIVVVPDYGEQGVDIMKEAAESDDVGLIAVDSLALMTPSKEYDGSATDNFVGLQAKLISSMLRKTGTQIAHAKKTGRNLCFIFINHVRTKIGTTTFMPSNIKPGGEMQDMLAFLDIRFYAKAYQKKGDTPITVTHSITIEKNKVGMPKRSGEYVMYLVDYEGKRKGEVEELKTIVEMAKRKGFIAREGVKWKYGAYEFDNLFKVHEHFRDNVSDFLALKDGLLEALIANPLGINSDEEISEEND